MQPFTFQWPFQLMFAGALQPYSACFDSYLQFSDNLTTDLNIYLECTRTFFLNRGQETKSLIISVGEGMNWTSENNLEITPPEGFYIFYYNGTMMVWSWIVWGINVFILGLSLTDAVFVHICVCSCIWSVSFWVWEIVLSCTCFYSTVWCLCTPIQQ